MNRVPVRRPRGPAVAIGPTVARTAVAIRAAVVAWAAMVAWAAVVVAVALAAATTRASAQADGSDQEASGVSSTSGATSVATCGKHITDVVRFHGKLFVATFTDGLCDPDRPAQRLSQLPARLINDLEVLNGRLFVAASEGLFVTRDGKRFRRFHPYVGAANALTHHRGSLWVTEPGALWRLRVGPGTPPSRIWRAPGGSGALQDVAITQTGTVFIATEDRGVLRLESGGSPDADHFEIFDRARGAPSSWVITVDVASDGTAYAGTLRHGVFRILPSGAMESVPTPDPWILRIRSGPEGLWIGTQGGAFLHRGGKLANLGPVPDPRVHALITLGKDLFLGTEGGLERRPRPTAVAKD
ncbi:MAG: hypothetical protein KC416_07610 [Myxococcales bacterium]|nr:hypothetical protein [Myxococcales bacterium]